MCTSEYTLHRNINDGNKAAEEVTAKKLLLVTNSPQKIFLEHCEVKWTPCQDIRVHHVLTLSAALTF